MYPPDSMWLSIPPVCWGYLHLFLKPFYFSICGYTDVAWPISILFSAQVNIFKKKLKNFKIGNGLVHIQRRPSSFYKFSSLGIKIERQSQKHLMLQFLFLLRYEHMTTDKESSHELVQLQHVWTPRTTVRQAQEPKTTRQ